MFRNMILVLFPLSLGLTGLVSAWYVGRSLRPVAELTQQAAEMAERAADSSRREPWRPLAVANPHDELGRLAATFNELFTGVDSALRQLRQFVSDASHELRTPLSVLRGETELILREPRTPEEYQKALRAIDDELKKLGRIVEGLFTLAMADAGQLRLTREPLYLNEILEESCTLAASQARTKEIIIDREMKEEVLYLGDEAFLRQLFLIFLDNAIKYSPPKSRIRVRLETPDGLVRAQFQDEGIGIAENDLPHIFERFYRAAPANYGEGHSGGLGLAIAQAIVRAEGGSIECQTAPGVGATFTINLPAPSRQAGPIAQAK
jgi:signal transduction histidine kinase